MCLIIVIESNNNFYIKYVPLIHCELCRDIICYLESLLPPYLIFREKDKTILQGEEAIYFILSEIISYVVYKFNEIEIKNKVCDTFFKGKEYKVEKFEESNTAKNISDFLEPLKIRKKDISPIIRIEPNNS